MLRILYGHAKNETLRETDPVNILACIETVEKKLKATPEGRHANAHREWLLAARAELALRRVYRFEKGIRSALGVRKAIRELAAVTHVVTPAKACVALLDGTAVAVTFLHFNGVLGPRETSNRDVYRNREGDLSLRKEALNEIARAAGIDWVARDCGRVDTRANPHYVEYRASATWRRFDDSEHTETDTRAVDLSPGSAEIADMTELQIAHSRQFILPIAESKAKARVIRDLGVFLTYSAAEFEKPFAVLRLVKTGRTKDKAQQRHLALQAQRSADAMYGSAGRP